MTAPQQDPGLGHVLDEVAIEMARQDAAGGGVDTGDRAVSLSIAALHLRSVLAIDRRATGGAQ